MPNPNLSNPEKLVNEARLNEYHQTILPYLGGHIECGFTPVGAVIMMSGNEAPKHYLKCDGTVYNIADYPELAAFYARSQGSCNFYGGNGTTTFAVPDLRGEFVRGTGTNSHANQGSGASVGIHQDGTEMPFVFGNTQNKKVTIRGYKDSHNNIIQTNPDKTILVSDYQAVITTEGTTETASASGTKGYIARPTNTSVLFCVASKNIYLDARFDYSLEEKVVGEWIDGATIYQKTVVLDSGISFADKGVTAIFNILEASTKNIVDMRGTFSFIYSNTGRAYTYSIGELHRSDNTETDYLWSTLDYNDDSNSKYVVAKIVQAMHSLGTTSTLQNITVTIQYTKTTD